MKSFLKSDFIYSNMIVIVCSNLAAAGNYLSSILLARYLVATDIGIFSAVMALPPAIYSVFSFIPYFVSREVLHNSQDPEALKKTISRIFYTHLSVTFIWTLCLAGLSPWISDFLKIDQTSMIVVLFFTLFLTVQINFLTGILQGNGNFLHMGFKDIALAGIKLCTISGLLFWGIKNPWIPLQAEILAVVVVLIVLWMTLRQYIVPLSQLKTYRPISLAAAIELFSKSSVTILSIVAIGVITSFDALIAKALLTDTDAGYFSTGSILAKIVLFVGGSSNLVLFVLTNKKRAQGLNTAKLFIMTIVLNVCLAGGAALVLFIFRHDILQLLYATKASNIVDILPTLLLNMLITSINIVFLNYFMAHHLWKHCIPLLAFFCTLFVYSKINQTPMSPVELAIILRNFLVFVLAYLSLVFVLSRARILDGRH